MEINDTIRLSDGSRGKILATPTGFLSNGSYEVEIDDQRKWVKEELILYVIDTEFEDDINNYFEIIYDENGIHMIPKKLEEITIDDAGEKVIIRTEARGTCSSVFRAMGMALPPTIQKM